MIPPVFALHESNSNPEVLLWLKDLGHQEIWSVQGGLKNLGRLGFVIRDQFYERHLRRSTNTPERLVVKKNGIFWLKFCDVVSFNLKSGYPSTASSSGVSCSDANVSHKIVHRSPLVLGSDLDSPLFASPSQECLRVGRLKFVMVTATFQWTYLSCLIWCQFLSPVSRSR